MESSTLLALIFCCWSCSWLPASQAHDALTRGSTLDKPNFDPRGQLRLVSQPLCFTSLASDQRCLSAHWKPSRRACSSPSRKRSRAHARARGFVSRADCKCAGVAWNAPMPLPAASTHLTSWQDFLKGAGRTRWQENTAAAAGRKCSRALTQTALRFYWQLQNQREEMFWWVLPFPFLPKCTKYSERGADRLLLNLLSVKSDFVTCVNKQNAAAAHEPFSARVIEWVIILVFWYI